MARIRTTKPEFWTDGDVMDLSPHARMLFHGSWNFTICDYGHLPDDPRRLKMQVLPADHVMMVRDPDAELGWRVTPLDPAVLVDEILASGRYARIEVNDRTYLHIVRFTDHQRLETRWTPRCPVCKALTGDPEPRGNSREVTRARRTSPQDRTGQDGTAAAAAGAAAAADLPTSIAILRSKMQAHTKLQALRFDNIAIDKMAAIEALILEHGDERLVQLALDTCRSTPPVHVAAFLGTWEAAPAPGERLRVVRQSFCTVKPNDHTLPLTPAGRCLACEVEAKVGDR